MTELKKQLKIAAITNGDKIRDIAKEWGIHEVLLHRVASGATKSQRITNKINEYIQRINIESGVKQ